MEHGRKLSVRFNISDPTQMNLSNNLASNDVFCLEGTTFIEFCSIFKIIDLLCQCLVLEDVVY